MKGHGTKTLLLLACAVLTSPVVFVVLTGWPVTVGGANLPGTIVIKHIEKQYSPVTFDHATHVELAGSCGKCHHMHNDKAAGTCRECHQIDASKFKASVKEGFLPCSGCHGDYSPEAVGMPGLKVAFHKKCFECHVGIGELGASPKGCVKTCHTSK